jgi:hypothetical protein
VKNLERQKIMEARVRVNRKHYDLDESWYRWSFRDEQVTGVKRWTKLQMKLKFQQLVSS